MSWWHVVVAVPHLLYFLAYHYGPHLAKFGSYEFFQSFFIGYRIVFYLATFVYAYQTVYHTWNIYEWLSPHYALVIGACFLILGAWLNASVYKAIGTDGVYYKCEMHSECKPRNNEFPYNVFMHPMYIASILCVIGVIFVFGCKKDGTWRQNVVLPLTYLICLYIFSMIVESFTPISQ